MVTPQAQGPTPDPASLARLEGAIRRIPGVLGCVVTPALGLVEVDVFTDHEVESGRVHASITDEIARHELSDAMFQVAVFELEAQPPAALLSELAEAEAAPTSDLRAAGGRPAIRQVTLIAAGGSTEAQVSLERGPSGTEQAVGSALGVQSSQGLEVLAEATLIAAGKIAGGDPLKLIGAALIQVLDRPAVCVLVAAPDGTELVGAVLASDNIAEGAVRATLDAINRRLWRSS